MSDIPLSSSAVATKQRIGLAVSLYVGFAVLTAGAVGGSLAAALLLKKTVSPVNCYSYESQLYRDGGLTKQVTKPSDCTSTQPAREVAYMPTDIMNVQASNEYKHTVGFYSGEAGPNAPTMAIFMSDFGDGTATVQTPAPLILAHNQVADDVSNILAIQTNLGVLNVCVPEFTAENQQFYVGSLGNTYTDPALTNRATTESCPSILSRVATPSSILQANSFQENVHFDFSRNVGILNQGSSPNFGNFELIPGSKVPLRIWTYQNPNVYGEPFSVITPENIVSIQTPEGVMSICTPKYEFTSFEEFYRKGIFYLSSDGTPYFDTLLSRRALVDSCSTILARGFQPTSIITGESYQPSIVSYYSRDSYDFSLGVMYGSNFQPNSTSFTVAGAPLKVSAYPSGFYPPTDLPVTMPANFFTLSTDQQQTVTICFPEVTYSDYQNIYLKGTFYIGKDGTPYTDVHMLHRAIPENCPSILGRGLQPTYVNQVTPSVSQLPNYALYFNRNSGYQNMGTLYTYGYQPGIGITSGTQAPLRVQYHNNGSGGVNAALLAHTLQLQTSPGNSTRTVCIPEVNAAFGDETVFYLGVSGLTYSDPFMRQVVCFQDGQQ